MNVAQYTEDFKRILDESGRITYYPMKKKHLRPQIFRYIHEKIEDTRVYSEKEFNELILTWIAFEDYAIIRRELCDREMMRRTKDGREYWKMAISS